MNQNDDFAAHTPDRVDPVDPLTVDPLTVEAAPVPEYTSGYVTPAVTAPTEAIPVVRRIVEPAVAPVAYPPLATAYRRDERLGDDRNPAWPYFLAFVALLAGGLVGYLIAFASDEDETPPAATAPAGDTTEGLDILLLRARENGEHLTPSEYPQVDEITEIDNAAATRELQTQIDEFEAAQQDATALTEQAANLETALADMTAERDAIAAEVGDSAGAAGEQQVALDASDNQIAVLEDELATARADLDVANGSLTEAGASLQTAISERDAATDIVEALDIIPNPTYINGAITKARSDAAANGWTLIEQPADSTTAAPGTVLDQAPPAGSNMINGSVLYVTVAERP